MTIGRIDISQTLKKVEQTLREDPTLSPSVRSLLELLVLIIQLLANKLGLNSKNSSKPPSQDPNRPRVSKEKNDRRAPAPRRPARPRREHPHPDRRS